MHTFNTRRTTRRLWPLALLCLITGLLGAGAAQASRIKEVAAA